jgi:hypothetical protein
LEPIGKVESVSVATPEITGLDPRLVEPFMNATVPVAAEGVTVAVRVTVWPCCDGFSDDVRTVVLGLLPVDEPYSPNSRLKLLLP